MSNTPASSCRCGLNSPRYRIIGAGRPVIRPNRRSVPAFITAVLIQAFFIPACLILAGCHENVRPIAEKALCVSDFQSVGCFRKSRPGGSFPIAHRGVPQLNNPNFPTNTAAAISRSFAIGIPITEVDLRLSPDGELFLFHDKRLNSAGWIYPPELEGAPISTISAGDLKKAFRRDTPIQVCGITFFRSIWLPLSSGLLLIDLKGDFEEVLPQLVKAADEADLTERIIIQAYDKFQADLIKSTEPRFGVMARVSPEFDLEQALAVSPVLFQIDSASDREAIDRIHQVGSKVLVKTLENDEPSNWKTVFSAGVDSILTDKAEAVLRSVPAAEIK